MSGKNDKKLRKMVSQTAKAQQYNTWTLFFSTIEKYPLKKRIKLAWLVLRGKNICGFDK